MRVGIGHSDNPDTQTAGVQAAQFALKQAGQRGPCDLVLLFSTASHDARRLREAVASVVGQNIPIVGGGAVGSISHEYYGYAGDQIILAAFWLEDSHCDVLFENGLEQGEEEIGVRLGQRLAAADTQPDSPVMLFYDAINKPGSALPLIMATPLLDGIEKGLGFFPRMVGAGLQGDFQCTPGFQWVGTETVQHSALAMKFSGNVRIDSVIMHGCSPATSYHTVTKADCQTILEVDGQPALPFFEKLLGKTIPAERLPFFLILGVNKGDKWGDFDEASYINRLCLGIDRKRQGIVMFEPNMVAGTEFQIMYRSMDLDYIAPRIEGAFDALKRENRKPVFAFYINCAGRAAGYAGIEQEDAIMVQKTVAGRVPLMGIYSGVEIASVMGRPTGLDWTGVFCLFSVAR